MAQLGGPRKKVPAWQGPPCTCFVPVMGASGQLSADARGQLQAAGWQGPCSWPAGQGHLHRPLGIRNLKAGRAAPGCRASAEATAMGSGHHPSSPCVATPMGPGQPGQKGLLSHSCPQSTHGSAWVCSQRTAHPWGAGDEHPWVPGALGPWLSCPHGGSAQALGLSKPFTVGSRGDTPSPQRPQGLSALQCQESWAGGGVALGGEPDTHLLPQVGPGVIHVDLLGVIANQVECSLQRGTARRRQVLGEEGRGDHAPCICGDTARGPPSPGGLDSSGGYGPHRPWGPLHPPCKMGSTVMSPILGMRG